MYVLYQRSVITGTDYSNCQVVFSKKDYLFYKYFSLFQFKRFLSKYVWSKYLLSSLSKQTLITIFYRIYNIRIVILVVKQILNNCKPSTYKNMNLIYRNVPNYCSLSNVTASVFPIYIPEYNT